MPSYKPNRIMGAYIEAADSPFDLLPGLVHAYDLTNGSIVLNMPSAPAPNDVVIVKQAPGTPTNGNTLTINPNATSTEIPTSSDTATLTTGTFQLPNLRTSFRWIYYEDEGTGLNPTWVCDMSHDPRGGQTVVEAQYTYSGVLPEGDGNNMNLVERFVYPAGAVTGPAPFPPALTIANAGRYFMGYTMRIPRITDGDFPDQMAGVSRRRAVAAYLTGTPGLVPPRAAEAEIDILYHVGLEGVLVPLGDERINRTNAMLSGLASISGFALLDLSAPNQEILFVTDCDYGGHSTEIEFSIFGII